MIRLLALSLIFLATVNVACAEEVFKVGVTTRDFIPAEPYDWRGAATHSLQATIWYPAASDAREQAQCNHSIFKDTKRPESWVVR